MYVYLWKVKLGWEVSLSPLIQKGYNNLASSDVPILSYLGDEPAIPCVKHTPGDTEINKAKVGLVRIKVFYTICFTPAAGTERPAQ